MPIWKAGPCPQCQIQWHVILCCSRCSPTHCYMVKLNNFVWPLGFHKWAHIHRANAKTWSEWSHGVEWFLERVFFGVEFWSVFLESKFGVSFADFRQRAQTDRQTDRQGERKRDMRIISASDSGPLPSLFKLCPWGQKWARPWGHMFYKGLHMENMKKSSPLKQQGLEPVLS